MWQKHKSSNFLHLIFQERPEEILGMSCNFNPLERVFFWFFPGQLMFFSFYNLKQLLKGLQIVKVSSKLFPLLSNSTLCSAPNKIKTFYGRYLFYLLSIIFYTPPLKTAFRYHHRHCKHRGLIHLQIFSFDSFDIHGKG